MRKQKDGKKLLKVILYWFPFISYIIIISPSSLFSFAGFYLTLSVALLYTFKTLFALERTIVWLVTILLYLLLRQFHIDNFISTLLLSGIFITLEIYFRRD